MFVDIDAIVEVEVGVWRQIGDSLELGNSLTTAKPKFVTFGQSLFIVCVDSLLWKALNCCWVCVYNTGRRQPWESAPRKLDPSLQNLISRYLLSPSIHIYPPKPAKKEIVFSIIILPMMHCFISLSWYKSDWRNSFGPMDSFCHQ